MRLGDGKFAAGFNPPCVTPQACHIEGVAPRERRIIPDEPLQRGGFDSAHRRPFEHWKIPALLANLASIDEPDVDPLLLRICAELACTPELSRCVAVAAVPPGFWRLKRRHGPRDAQ